MSRSALTASKFPIHCRDTSEVCPDYRTYLQSRHWADFKRRYYASKVFRSPSAFGGINSKCVCCQIPNKPLDIHHLTYLRLGCEKFWDVIPLCRECHSAAHAMFRTVVKAGEIAYQMRRAWKLVRRDLRRQERLAA